MPARIAMLLGRTVWTRESGGWRHEAFREGAGTARESVERLAEALSSLARERTIAVFEPEGLAHQVVETPNVKREAFASLARVRDQHPVVDSETLGWGIELPEPGPRGEFSTMIHSEMTPGLIEVRDACARAGCPLSAAWSVYSAAVSCARYGRPVPKARFALVLTPEFCAIATFGAGKRSFKTWVGPMSERDWKAFSASIGDAEAGPSPTMSEPGSRRGSIIVIADGDPERHCPIWSDLRATGRVAAIVDLDVFATNAARIPMSHPANLIEAFPRPRDLDRLLAAAAIGGFAVALALAAVVLNDRKQIFSEDAASRARETSLEALVLGSGFDQDSTRLALERRGFAPSKDKGWIYDVGAGRLRARGKFGEGQP